MESEKKRKWVFLTDESRNKLTQIYPGIHSVKKADHITLESPVENVENIGDSVKFKVTGYAKDDLAEAVSVELPEEIQSHNKIPHITISVKGGVNPTYSNELLEKNIEPIEPIELEGIIGIQEKSWRQKPLKIAYIIPRFFPFKGGAEENIHAVSTRTALEGHDVTVLTTNIKFRNEILAKKEIIDAVRVIRHWALSKALYAGFYPALLFHLLRNRYDIIHTSGIGFFWREFCLILTKLRFPKTKFITTPHGPFMALGDTKGFRGFARNLGTWILKRYLNWLYDRVIAVNPKQHVWLTQLYNFKEDKIVVIPNGINEDYIEKRLIEHTPEEKVVITYMNRMEWYKGIQDVIRALDKLIDKRSKIEDNFVFYVMGKAGSYTEKLKELVEKLELENYVKFIFHPSDGERDRIFYEESQINILPSKWEATGITLIEAMAKGNVIITTTGNEASDILIEEGVNGFIYDFGDVEALKGILKNLLTNYELRQEMRKKNLELARKFTWDAVLPKYIELINELAA